MSDTAVLADHLPAEPFERPRPGFVRALSHIVAWLLVVLTILFECVTFMLLWQTTYLDAAIAAVCAMTLFGVAWVVWEAAARTMSMADPGGTYRWDVLATVWSGDTRPPLVPATLTIEPQRVVVE